MNKKLKISAIIVKRDPELFFISESEDDNELLFDGYNLIHRTNRPDTQDGRGGGILLYLKSDIEFRTVSLDTEFDQICCIKIGEVNIMCLYRSPNSTVEQNCELNKAMDSLVSPTVILGVANAISQVWIGLNCTLATTVRAILSMQ